ncbi:MAG: prepilin peptidase [Dehalococcoidia bacterium]|nr:prepilin peptidase [Dehalococcoidia bacterium]
MGLLLTIIFGLLGAAVGSFLNVCIDRLPAGKSLVYPPSFCESCQRRISPTELIPVFSYLWLRGRCRHCGARIPLRVFLVELAAALVFILLFWYYGLSAHFGVTVFYFCLFIVLGVIDLEHRLILNKIVYPTTIVVLLIDAFLSSFGIISGLIGMAIGFIFLLIPVIATRGRGMGFGDVKLAGLIGLVTGFPLLIVALFIGVILGGLVAIFLLVLRIKKRKEAIPFGPFLALGTMATLVWGNALLDWYLGLL